MNFNLSYSKLQVKKTLLSHTLWCVFALLCTFETTAQQIFSEANPNLSDLAIAIEAEKDEYVTIQNIDILGNDKTQERIILRELSVEAGDVISRQDLEKILENDKNKLINTRLFLSIDFKINDLPNRFIEIMLEVKERWYLFPVPVIKLETRNFNDWWENQDRDLAWLSYGMKFYQYNFRGRNEKLKLEAQFGYTKKFEMDYNIPYIDRSQRHGIRLRASFFENHRINYITQYNIPIQVNIPDSPAREAIYGGITYSHRPSFYSFHFFTLGYQNSRIHDSVAILNPSYFLDGRTQQKMFRFHYRYRKEVRDNVAYPLKGYMFNFEIDKMGLGIYDDINQMELSADYYKYFDLGKHYYLSSRVRGNISFPKQQPYSNFRGLGYGAENIRGLEIYVIDGQSYFLNKLTFKKRLFYTETRINNIVRKKQFNTIPLAVYIKTYFDGGYVNNSNLATLETDRLSNRYVYGTGLGLDFVTYYDFVMRVEYSINSLGQGGWFLNFRSDLR